MISDKVEPYKAIRDIEAKKQKLQDTVKKNKKISKKADKQNKAINSYLGNQEGVTSDDKKK